MATQTLTPQQADLAACLFSEIATLANATRKVHLELMEGDDAYAIGKLIETIGWMADHGHKSLAGCVGAVGSAQEWMLCPESRGDTNV